MENNNVIFCEWKNPSSNILECKYCSNIINVSPIFIKPINVPCERFLKPPNKPLNFIKAVTKFIALSIWKRELQYVNGEQYKERLELCDACNHRHPEKPECIICGCKLKAIFNKAQLKTELCPLGKWPRLYEINPIQVSK